MPTSIVVNDQINTKTGLHIHSNPLQDWSVGVVLLSSSTTMLRRGYEKAFISGLHSQVIS